MNPHHKPKKKIVVGCSGSGKSTMVHKLAQTSGYPWRYVFDWNLQVATTLHWMAAVSLDGLCRLQDARRPVVFYPREMFADLEEAFSFFCAFIMNQAERRSGPKLFIFDEAQEYLTTNFARFPKPFKLLLNYGRNEEIDMVIAAQRFSALNNQTRTQITELFVFKHPDTDTESFEQLAKVGIAPEAVKALPHPLMHRKVGWIYRHCLTGKMQTIVHEIN